MNSNEKFRIPKRKPSVNEIEVEETGNRSNQPAKVARTKQQTGANFQPEKSSVFEKDEKVAYYHTKHSKVYYGVIKDFAKGSILIAHPNGTVHSIRRETVVKLTAD